MTPTSGRGSTTPRSEEEQILRELGLDPATLSVEATLTKKTGDSIHPVIAFGLCCGVALNIGMIMSLPMVIMNRGAPYLPTFSKRADVMFQQLRKFNSKHKKISEQTIIDLGSGDGRLVVQAAHEGYKLAIGYELNPALHVFANMRRFTSWKLIGSTKFYWKDLWKAPLRDADVVVVYGWGSIMSELQNKFETELKPGSVVVSNVFKLPTWKPVSVVDNVYLYKTPECYRNVSSSSPSGSRSS